MAFSVGSTVARPAAVSRDIKARQVVCMAVGARKKGARKAAFYRPIKYCKSDRNHGPAQYAPLPAPPPEFVVVAKPAEK